MMQTDHTRRARLLLAAAVALALLLPVAALHSQDKDKKDKKEVSGTTSLKIEVTGGEKPEGVDNASVYVKYQHERMLAKDKTIEMNVKTNREGIARVPSVPRGKVLVQVIAPGWKTFGQWYELSSAEQTIKITLQRPPRWY